MSKDKLYQQNSGYTYSNSEKGKDGTINPNYYADGNPHSDKMLLDHIEDIFPKPYVVGFYVITIFKYLKRFPRKNHIQDLKKARTYLKHLTNYVKRCN